MARIEAVSRRHRRGRHEARGRPRRRRRAGDPARPVPGLRRRRQPRPDPARVRAPAAARRDPGPGARARDDLPAGLGLRDGPRRPLGRRLHPQAAPEAREALARLELHPHPLRGRLPLRPGAGRHRRGAAAPRSAAESRRRIRAVFTGRSQRASPRDNRPPRPRAAMLGGAWRSEPGNSSQLAAGRLEIRPEEHAALVDGRPLSLTMRELQLLVTLASHPQRIMTREELFTEVWGSRAAARGPLGRRLRQPPARQARRGAAGHAADPHPQRHRLPLLARRLRSARSGAGSRRFYIFFTSPLQRR